VYPLLAAMSCVSLLPVARLERAAFTGEASGSLGAHLAAARDDAQQPRGGDRGLLLPQGKQASARHSTRRLRLVLSEHRVSPRDVCLHARKMA
jgi:hypothetical protein